MTDPLSLDRFRDLADAYGGVVARWPEPVRDAAMRMATQPAAAEILAQASVLDDRLDAWRTAAPPAALIARVAAGAPIRRRNLARRARLWWSGIGIAAALTGAVAGAAAVALIAPVEASSDGATSFGDVATQET